jgi:hypothetical protein
VGSGTWRTCRQVDGMSRFERILFLLRFVLHRRTMSVSCANGFWVRAAGNSPARAPFARAVLLWHEDAFAAYGGELLARAGRQTRWHCRNAARKKKKDGRCCGALAFPWAYHECTYRNIALPWKICFFFTNSRRSVSRTILLILPFSISSIHWHGPAAAGRVVADRRCRPASNCLKRCCVARSMRVRSAQ